MRTKSLRLGLLVVLFATLFILPTEAGGHTWRVKEIFSNADGTIQFIEVWEANGTPGEIGTAGHDVSSNTSFFTIPANVAAPTTLRSILLATQAFADLNVVTPDYIIPANFFSVVNDSIRYVPFHTVTYLAGALPTDGVMSLNADLTIGVNSPQNYAGDMGSVNLNPAPPGVLATGAQPLRATALVADGSSIRLSFDTSTCSGNTEHQVLYGFGSGLPTSLGGVFGTSGSSCGVALSPFDWTGVPDPASDATRLLWYLVQATDGATTEGSLGKDSSGAERQGPGPAMSSGECGITDKSLSNTCGQ